LDAGSCYPTKIEYFGIVGAYLTSHAQFLADMHLIVPWAELAAVVEPFYPKVSEAVGRPPLPLERMLRVYFLQLWFNLSDRAVEEQLYDSVAMGNFAGIDLGVEAAPDETTVCKKNKPGKKLLTT
jgi:IS5 family transposase